MHYICSGPVGHVDYEEWFESVDIGSVPLLAVASPTLTHLLTCANVTCHFWDLV